MADPRWMERQRGWRKHVGDIDALLGALADHLVDLSGQGRSIVIARDGQTHLAEDLVRRAVHLLRSAQGNVTAEERHAWDLYVASGGPAVPKAIERADLLLEERRKRFAKKEEP